MMFLSSEKNAHVLRTETRSDDHGIYTYRLFAFTDGLHEGHAMEVVYDGADGYRSEQRVTLPYVSPALAQAFFCLAVDRLVSPLALPYILEDGCTP